MLESSAAAWSSSRSLDIGTAINELLLVWMASEAHFDRCCPAGVSGARASGPFRQELTWVTTMEAMPTQIINYFSGFKQNLVPLFQRPYTWGERQW